MWIQLFLPIYSLETLKQDVPYAIVISEIPKLRNSIIIALFFSFKSRFSLTTQCDFCCFLLHVFFFTCSASLVILCNFASVIDTTTNSPFLFILHSHTLNQHVLSFEWNFTLSSNRRFRCASFSFAVQCDFCCFLFHGFFFSRSESLVIL